MFYKILCNFWLICCNIIGRLFCKRKGGHDLAGPYIYGQDVQTVPISLRHVIFPLLRASSVARTLLVSNDHETGFRDGSLQAPE